MADDNIFDFEKFKKQLDEMKRMQEKYKKEQEEAKKTSSQDSFSKMFEMYSSLFTPPSQEEVDKAVSQFADSLEKMAEVIREIQSDTNKKEEPEDGEGDEE